MAVKLGHLLAHTDTQVLPWWNERPTKSIKLVCPNMEIGNSKAFLLTVFLTGYMRLYVVDLCGWKKYSGEGLKQNTQTNPERDWDWEKVKKMMVDSTEELCLFCYVSCVDDHVHVGRWLGSCGSMEACEMLTMWGGQPIGSAEWVERDGTHIRTRGVESLGRPQGQSEARLCSAEVAFHILRFQQSATLHTAGRPGYSSCPCSAQHVRSWVVAHTLTRPHTTTQMQLQTCTYK